MLIGPNTDQHASGNQKETKRKRLKKKKSSEFQLIQRPNESIDSINPTAPLNLKQASGALLVINSINN